MVQVGAGVMVMVRRWRSGGAGRTHLFSIRCLERHHVGIVIVFLVQEAAADKNSSSSLLPMHLLTLGLQMIK